MKELIEGHRYLVDNLKESGTSVIEFYMDPHIHNGQSQTGTSTQEIIRVAIARTLSLDKEKPHPFNESIVKHLRHALAYFEMRALQLHIDKGMPIEDLPTNEDGHIL